MGNLGILLLLFIPAYFLYSLHASLHSAKQRQAEADRHFGTVFEHSQEDMDALHAQWEAQKMPDRHEVDDITWNDLDMNLVFHRVNACLTTPGEEQLYNRMRVLNGVEDDWEPLITALELNPELRLHIQSLLIRVGKSSDSGLPNLLRHPDEYRLPQAIIYRIAAFMPFFAACLVLLPGMAGVGFVALVPVLLLNLVLYLRSTKMLQGKLHTIRYVKALIWLAKKLAKVSNSGLDSLLNNVRTAAVPFAKLRDAFSAAAQEGAAAGDMAAFMMFGQVFFLTEIRAYNRVMKAISKHTKELDALYKTIGRLDVLISTLSLRKSLSHYCLPLFHDQISLETEDIVHPLVENCVPNSASFQRGVLLTGSNASGKSTFIKAFAINAILAQSVNTCTAVSFALPRAKVISSMALRDNLSCGESYFVVEVKSFCRMLQAVDQSPCLCFVDEILRGTNTIERIAASAAVLKSLQTANSLCVAATHDIELTALLSSQYDNYHFKEELKDKGIIFDYHLREGPSNTRNALLLLGVYDFAPDVVHQASTMVKTFEQMHHWITPGKAEGGDTSAPAQIR